MSGYATTWSGANSIVSNNPYELLRQIVTHREIVASAKNKLRESALLDLRDQYLFFISSDTLELNETSDESRRARIRARISDSRRQISDLDYQLLKLNGNVASSERWLSMLDSRVDFFSVVTIKLPGQDETQEFMIVADGYRSIPLPTHLDTLSYCAPLGAALMGNQAGDKVNLRLPSGATREVEILKVRIASESELSEICNELDKQGGRSKIGQIYAVDFRYNVSSIESMPHYVHGSMPARERMGG